MADSTCSTVCAWPECTETCIKPPRGVTPKHCPTHTREAKNQAARAYSRTHRSSRVCTEDDCGQPVKGRDLCGMHYRRWERANGMATPPSDSWSPQRRAQWKKRHAIKRGADRDRAETIYPEAVYQRDDWTCQLCGNPVDKTLEFPNQMSASLDHRIPLAKGGTHTRDNTQLAHFACNVKKGSRHEPISLR